MKFIYTFVILAGAACISAVPTPGDSDVIDLDKRGGNSNGVGNANGIGNCNGNNNCVGNFNGDGIFNCDSATGSCNGNFKCFGKFGCIKTR